jgi:uncharacterized protein (TIGR02217 family)
MAYLDILLPTGVDLIWVGGFGFSTQVAITASGAESRNQEWAYNRSTYKVTYNARLPVAWLEFEAFFGLAAGRANTWRLRDPRDNACIAAQGKFVVIDSTHAQMVKRYTFGALAFDTPVTKPAAGITFTGGTGVSYSQTTGIVTHSGIPTEWAGTFYKHCRFDTDVLELDGIDKQANGQLIAGWRDVPIVEVTLE